MGIKPPSRAWVAVIYRPGEIISPEYAIYKAPDHYLANLEVIHPVFSVYLPDTMVEMYLSLSPEKKNSYPIPPGRTRKT